MRPRSRLATLTAAVAAAGLAAPGVAAAAPTALGDFDGDGHADLAIGAPADSVRGQPRAGAVNVIYGTSGGLTAAGDQQFTQRGTQVPGVPTPGAQFGLALATGDLDGDGFGDLAVGVPGEDVGGLRDAGQSGRVIVFYGSPSGLRESSAEGWSQNSIGIKGGADPDDRFGDALAIADFDGDGFDDLGIGVPGEDVGGQNAAGAVNVLYGTSGGLSERGDQLWTQNTRGIKGISGRNHRMGEALAAGDLSENGRAELAIGIPGGRIGGNSNAGAVLVLYGRSDGLSSVDDLWSQDARGIKGVAETNDVFGNALAVGDFDEDGAGDLAVGAPRDDVGNADGAGAVNVLYGSGGGLRHAGDDLWTQDTRGIKSRASIGERFGDALTAGDFSGNGADDLAIGVPGQQIGADVSAGAVSVLYGGARGLSEAGDQFWSQDSRGIKGRSEADDLFGSALGAGDFDGDGLHDLVIGTPLDSVGRSQDAGAVNVVYGSRGGLREDPDELWTQGTRGIKGAVGNDLFGTALGSGVAAD